MSSPTVEVIAAPQVDEKVWAAWTEKNRVARLATERKMRVFAFAVVVLIGSVGAYLVGGR